jgi:hypothetical protein
MRFAATVGRFNSRLLLSLVFYLMVFPLSLVVKMFSGDRLGLKFDENSESYWTEKSQRKTEKDRYERQF